jgi:integrase
VKSRRLTENPFRFLEKLNTELDIRHQRRPLDSEEFARLLAAPKIGSPYAGVSGPDRAMLYFTAAATGLRASELASLKPASFNLDANPPTVTLEAAYSKHRREDTLPLHSELVAILEPVIDFRRKPA